jgi:hypothetical protein
MCGRLKRPNFNLLRVFIKTSIWGESFWRRGIIIMIIFVFMPQREIQRIMKKMEGRKNGYEEKNSINELSVVEDNWLKNLQVVLWNFSKL